MRGSRRGWRADCDTAGPARSALAPQSMDAPASVRLAGAGATTREPKRSHRTALAAPAALATATMEPTTNALQRRTTRRYGRCVAHAIRSYYGGLARVRNVRSAVVRTIAPSGRCGSGHGTSRGPWSSS
jgi:hypothetical protein